MVYLVASPTNIAAMPRKKIKCLNDDRIPNGLLTGASYIPKIGEMIQIWRAYFFQMGVSLNGGTPKTRQNDHF